MYQSLEDLSGYHIQGKEEELGEVDQFIFDHEKWVVRYLVLSSGGLISRKRVLISPLSITDISVEDRRIWVNLTRDQIEKSPDFDLEEPISREHEATFFEYYRWPYYWTGAGLWGIAPTPVGLNNVSPEEGIATPSPELGTFPYPTPDLNPEQDLNRSRLISHKEVRGYGIEARDRRFGHVEDLIVNTTDWAIRYLVIDTVNFWPSKSVLISPPWIDSVSWAQEKIRVDLDEETIKSAPPFVALSDLTPEYEDRLRTHFDRYFRRSA